MSTDFVKQTMRENLGRVLIPHIADGLWSIYDSAKTACERNGQPEKTLQTFQNLLTRIPQWSEETLRKEVDRISLASKCDYIEDLLLGVFVSYIRAFASLQQAETTHVNIEFDRPSLSKFVHSFYNAAARKSWSNAYLFKTIGVSSEQQARNRRDIETLLEATMSEVVDTFIPWRDISKAYFQARSEAAPAPKPAPVAQAPAKPVTFGMSEVKEFETDDEEDDDEQDSEYDSEEERPRMTTGEETKLDFDDDSGAESDDTEAELEKKAKGTETVSLNL
jgi:hypothetical protein